MPDKLTSPPANKLLGLELLRFAAAFAVLIWHYQHFAYVADKAVDFTADRLPLYGLLQPFYEAGEYGVWLFWCISGYIFFWKYRDAGAKFRSRPSAALARCHSGDARVDADPSDLAARGGLKRC